MSFQNVLIPGTGAAYCIEKDDDGLLWIGTGDGLYCYDGYRCYRREGDLKDNPYGIQAMKIIDYDIYLGCDNGFFVYDIKTNKFKRLVADIREINALLPYGQKIYIGCKEGLWAWDIADKQARSVVNGIKSVYAIAEYGENLLVGALNGLYLIKDGKAFKRDYSTYVGVIIPDIVDGFFWIGAEGNLFYYDASIDKLHPAINMSGNYVKSLSFDTDKNLYIGTDNGLFVKNGNDIKSFRHDSSNPSTIQNNIICDIYIDKQNNVWLGNNVGFSMIPYKSLCDIVSLEALTKKYNGNLIYAISQDNEHNLWLGGTDGLIRIDKYNSDKAADWYNQSDHRFPILHNRVRDIYNDSDGDVWILTDHGINLYDMDTKKLINYIVENEDGHYSCRWAYDIYMDDKRNMWIAAFNEGVFVINKDILVKSNGKCKADAFYGKSNGKLAGEHGYHIVPDLKKRIWVSSNAGIDRIEPTSQRVTHISDISATSMLTDCQGRIWTSFENGIRSYDNEGTIVRDYYFDEKDHSVRFVKLLEIDSLVWAITQYDSRIIHPDGKVSIISLPDINIQSAYYSDEDGKLLIGGLDKLAYIDCKMVSQLEHDQNLILAELRVNGHSYKADSAIAYMKELKLDYDENNLEFLLTDVPDSKKISPHYAYKMEGNGEQWFPLSSDKKIITNGLPYGSYELVICTVDGMGNRLNEVYRLPIRIAPPWYLSIYAKLVYLLLIALLILGVRHFYHVKKRLHEEEDRRRKILEQQEMRARFFRNLSVEIKKLLANIIVPAEKVLGSSPSPELKSLTKDIRYSATQINALIRQAFDLNNPKNSIKNLHIASIDVIRFCRGFMRVFEEKHPEFSSLKYTFQSETAELRKKILIVRFDSVFNIVVNYLSRHAMQGGRIQLHLKQNTDKLVIEITGEPLSADIQNIDRLFDRYNQTIESPSEIDNSELYLAREYVVSMNGDIEADYNAEHKSLSFKITLPIDVKKEQSEGNNSNQTDEAPENLHVEAKRKANNDKDNEESLLLITNIIEKHISDFEFSVSMLQFELNMGEKTLYRRVKQLTGLTPVEYIRHIRMNRAALLLKEGNFTVSEVMYMVGFSNSGYFSKCFQAVYEITPTKYKQKWKQAPAQEQDKKE